MCGKSFGPSYGFAGRIVVSLALLSLAASLPLAAWSNPLFPKETKAVPVSEQALESAPAGPVDGTASQEQYAPTQTSPVEESKTLVSGLADTSRTTVKVKTDDLKAVDQALAYADNTIGLLTADNDRMAAEITRQDKEIGRWHLGLGFGAMANMDMDFGATAYLTARKGSFLMLGGVGYIPLDKDFEKDRFNYQVGIVYEF